MSEKSIDLNISPEVLVVTIRLYIYTMTYVQYGDKNGLLRPIAQDHWPTN